MRYHGRTIPITPVIGQLLEEQRRAFKEKFGRDPRPEEPVFFDPDSSTPQPIDANPRAMAKVREDLIAAALECEIDPAIVLEWWDNN